MTFQKFCDKYASSIDLSNVNIDAQDCTPNVPENIKGILKTISSIIPRADKVETPAYIEQVIIEGVLNEDVISAHAGVEVDTSTFIGIRNALFGNNIEDITDGQMNILKTVIGYLILSDQLK